MKKTRLILAVLIFNIVATSGASAARESERKKCENSLAGILKTEKKMDKYIEEERVLLLSQIGTSKSLYFLQFVIFCPDFTDSKQFTKTFRSTHERGNIYCDKISKLVKNRDPKHSAIQDKEDRYESCSIIRRNADNAMKLLRDNRVEKKKKEIAYSLLKGIRKKFSSECKNYELYDPYMSLMETKKYLYEKRGNS